jgi:hypothetical protein
MRRHLLSFGSELGAQGATDRRLMNRRANVVLFSAIESGLNNLSSQLFFSFRPMSVNDSAV